MPVDVCQTQNKHGSLPADAGGMRLKYAFEHIVEKDSHVSIELSYEIGLETGEIIERQCIQFFNLFSIKCEVFLV